MRVAGDAGRLLEDTFITIRDAEHNELSGYEVVCIKRTPHRETKIVLRTFVNPDRTLCVDMGMRAKSYAEAVSEFFGLEIRP